MSESTSPSPIIPHPAPRTPHPASSAKPVTLTLLLDALIAVAVVALGFLVASFVIRQGDYFQRLAVGGQVRAGLFPFGHDPFSPEDRPWVHAAWLFDTAVSLVHDRFGPAGAVVAKAAAVALAALLLVSIRRPGAGFVLPALATSLALVAAGPALSMRPVVASLLLLAALLRLLHAPPKSTTWFLVLVGLLHALWANFDAAFWVGPVVIALFAVGESLRREDRTTTPAVLFAALAVALVSSCLTPYGPKVYAAALADLLPVPISEELLREAGLAGSYLKPASFDYLDQVGRPAALALYTLVALGFVAFAVSAGKWRWGWLLAWFVLAFWATTRYRSVPLFAAVAAPALAWHLSAAFANRPAFADATVGLVGRAGAFAFIAALLAAAWPGWLHRTGLPGQSRSVAWGLEADPQLQRQAESLAGLYATGKLDSVRERPAFFHIDLPYYCAYFCPQAKPISDARLIDPAAFADALELRRRFASLAEATPDIDGLREAFRRRGITYVVAGGYTFGGKDRERERFDPLPIEPRLWQAASEWPVWAVAGNGIVHGWNDPAGTPSAPRPAPLDLVALAFHSDLASAPALTPERLALPGDGRPAVPIGPNGPDTAEAAYYLQYAQWSRTQLNMADQFAGLWAGVSDVVMSASVALGAGPCDPTMLRRLATDPGTVGRVVGQSLPNADGSLAAPFLALRRARQAMTATPADPEPHALAAQACELLPGAAAVRRSQQITGWQGALARVPNAQAAGRDTRPLEYAASDRLATLFEQTNGQLDLALVSEKRALASLSGVAGGPNGNEQIQRMAQERGRRLEQLEKFVHGRRNDFEIRGQSQDVAKRVDLARASGLPGEALTILRKLPEGELPPQLIVPFIALELQAGHAEAAHAYLGQPGLAPERAPAPLQDALRELRLQTALALGDTAAARTELDRAIELAATAAKPDPNVAALLAGMLTMPDPLLVNPLSRYTTMPYWGSLFEGRRQARSNLAAAHFQRALTALEAGDGKVAKFHLQWLTTNGGAEYQAVTRRYLEVVGGR